VNKLLQKNISCGLTHKQYSTKLTIRHRMAPAFLLIM